MTMGLQDLMMFRDNLQQPEPTGLDNLRSLQALTMQSMADEQYANMAFGGLVDNMVDPNAAMRYAATGGLVSLPVVQAGFGGFLKKVFKTAAKVPGVKLLGRAVIRPLSKSKVGRFALSAAPLILSGGNPALAAAIAAGIKIAGDPNQEGNPYKVLQSAGKAYAGAKIGQAMKGAPGGSEGYAATAGDRAAQLSDAAASGIPTATAPAASTNIFGDIGRSLTDAAYDPQGTVLSRLGERIAGTGQFEGLGLREQLGLPPAATGAETTTDTTPAFTKAVQQSQEQARAALEPTFRQRLAESMPFSGTDKPGFLLGRELSNVPILGKFVPESAAGQLAAGAGVLSGVASLQGQQGQIPQDQLAMAGLTPVETDFDKQVFTYRDAQGNILTTEEALRRIQEASQSFGAGGQQVASGVRAGFDRVDNLPVKRPLGSVEELGQFATSNLKPIFMSQSGGMVDPVLSASGGLIGMAYGGSMPMNDMDVKYKEFSGMVGGRGSGMEDNVYMPIVEGESGQQVATLAVSPKEYVVDANTMSLLGNGNPDEGAEIMDKTVKDIRMAATGQTKQQKEIDGLAALNRMRRSV